MRRRLVLWEELELRGEGPKAVQRLTMRDV